MADVRLGAAARRDLRDIRTAGIREHGEAASAAYLLGFERLSALLRQRPLAGQSRPDFRPAVRGRSHRPYRILYRVIGETVAIDRIIHQARDVGRVLREDH